MGERQSKASMVLLIVLLLVLSSTVGVSYSFRKEQRNEPKETASSGLMNSSWPMKCHDQRHTGRSPYGTAQNPPGSEKWRIFCDGWVDDDPVIDKDGIIYFHGSYKELSRYIFAVYPNGTVKWRFKVNGLLLGSQPAIAEDGTVYFGCWDDYLYAINPDGSLKWKFLSGGSISSSPVIGNDGTIYFGNFAERLYALNPNGTQKWRFNAGGNILSDPVLDDNGIIYFGSWDTYFYAINPNGTLRWRYKTGHYIKGPASVDDDGTIYIGSYDDYLYAFHPNGTVKWRHKLTYGTETNPTIGPDGTIYVGHDKFYAINPDGTRKWTLELGLNRHIHHSSPAVCDDGIIYVGVDIGEISGGELLAINPNGTERWRRRIASNWADSSPCIGPDGTIYIGSCSTNPDDNEAYGYLHAFGIADLSVDIKGPYTGRTNKSIKFTSTVFGGYPPYTYIWNFGDGNTSTAANPSHSYVYPGNYTIKLTVNDSRENTTTETTIASIIQGNDPPSKPSITGETRGKVGETYNYTFVSNDPEGHMVSYYVDWGDDTYSDWTDFYPSGEQITLSHTWETRGSYTIRARAKDTFDAVSGWGTLSVRMPKCKIDFFSNQKYLGLKNYMNLNTFFR